MKENHLTFRIYINDILKMVRSLSLEVVMTFVVYYSLY